MRTISISILAITLAAIAMTGCDEPDTAESISKEIVANMKELGVILSGITDEASARSAVPRIEAVRVKMRDCGQRAKRVPKIDAATEQKIAQATQKDMTEAIGMIGAAQERLMAKPDLMKIIEPAMQNMDGDL